MIEDVWVSKRRGFPAFILEKQAEVLPQYLLEGSTLMATREKMLEYLPKNSKMMEVGTRSGEFAKSILDITQPSELHVVDIMMARFMDELFDGYNGLTKHHMDSQLAMDQFDNGYFDWIYIDSDNSYESGIKDLNKAYKKVKTGGLIVVNGYNMWSPGEMKPYGYFRATNEIAIREKMQFLYLSLDTNGYHDVALLKT